ncbi:MAG TPA: lytic murein transglycosylase [Pseudolabrys sp.]|jgi:lytic murein transglycosylase|nr:lytic murein transglycosylase [Pseudolabrys sp.]
MRKIALTLAALMIGALSAAPALAAACHNTGSYERWLEQFKQDAAAQGISRKVIAEASPSMTFDPAIVRRDHGQAVFNQTFLQFSDRMVGGARIPNGLKKIHEHAKLFAEVEKKYGVPAPVLTAFWGLESDFGANFGNYKILSALATLAYDCRRPDFFRKQLFDALRIIERGDQTVGSMIGDWAGEFGGMQFTASDYLKSGVDFDGDGRRDLIHSVPDTVASAANFLVGLGWKRGEPWLQEVRVPQTLAWDQADLTITHPRSQWVAWGVRAAHGTLASDNLPASLILPMGRHGPAFLAYPNFQAFLGWNSAYVYSTTVAYFATRLAGAPQVDHSGAKTVPVLSAQQVMELQRLLNTHGYDVGEVDGKVGSGTRAAVKKAQMKAGLPADSYPTAELIEKLRAR